MKNRRMLSMKIIDTDAFLDMPTSSQLLYFHLVMRADDDGFVASPKRIMRMLGSQDDDYKVLIAKRFIIPFESGICVIKHWLIHNYIRKDRYTPTQYIKEIKMLDISKYNKRYSLNSGNKENDIPKVASRGTQVKLNQVKLNKETSLSDKSDEEDIRLSNLLYEKILENNPNHRKPNIESWAKHISLMRRIDKRTIKQIEYIINWCQKDSFWQSNILSTKKLREKFDQLVIKIKSNIVKKNKNEMRLNDGTIAIRKFGQWIDKFSGARLDSNYYPEIAKDSLPEPDKKLLA